MSAAEEIQAAIDKLTALKSESTKGPWEGWRKHDPLRGTQFGIEAASAEVAKVYTVEDAELIEVLHATIDAQLAVLHEAAYQISTGDGFIQKELNLFLRLAGAVNGGTK